MTSKTCAKRDAFMSSDDSSFMLCVFMHDLLELSLHRHGLVATRVFKVFFIILLYDIVELDGT